MKTYVIKTLATLSLLSPFPLFCQTQESNFDFERGTASSAVYGPRAGDVDFMIGGSGTSNKDFDDSLGGINFSVGQYLRSTQQIVLRQTINYSNPSDQGRSWNGASRIAFDQYFLDRTPWRPFAGASLGGVYGDNVRDTWAAGLEAGLKYYVRPRVFIELIAEYAWYFRHSNKIDNSFDTGQWNWALGTGFTF